MLKLRPLKRFVSPTLRQLAFRFFCGLSIFVVCVATCASSQNASSLSQIRKLYVAPLGQGKLGAEFRERVANRLRKDGSLAVVDDRQQADAVLTGDGQIWVTGHVSNNPHSSSAAAHAVYSGFLSVRVTDKKNDVLWSYLVTPRKIAWGGIVHDLADNLTAKLLDARTEKADATAAVPARNSAEVFIHGAGATFPAPLYQKWFQSIQEQQPNERIGYDGIGSDEGVLQLSGRKVDFAATDMPLADEKMLQLSARFRHFASVLGAVVPIYNLAGIGAPLKFTPEVLAEIYLGKITRWSDPKIRAANRGVSLPDAEILVVHRSDGSGTTFVWSDFLSKVSPAWKSGPGLGSELKWPVGTGAERNEGVASTVQQTPNSIGYVEMVFALQHQLSFGAVRNASGAFIRADLSSVTAAAASAASNMTSDFRVSITNPPSAEAHPIASFTWLLLPENADPSHKAALNEMMEWILTSGQKECSELGYAPLPRAVADRELDALHARK